MIRATTPTMAKPEGHNASRRADNGKDAERRIPGERLLAVIIVATLVLIVGAFIFAAIHAP